MRKVQNLLDDEKLNEKIQALPQELQDAMLGFTISVDLPDNEPIRITKKYQPPLGLQLDRKTRDRFANQYYSGAVFQVADQSFNDMFPWRGKYHETSILKLYRWAFFTFIRWYETLEVSHQPLLQTVRLELGPPRNLISLTPMDPHRLFRHALVHLSDFDTIFGRYINIPPKGVLVLQQCSAADEEWITQN